MKPAVSWHEEQAVVTLGWYAYRERGDIESLYTLQAATAIA